MSKAKIDGRSPRKRPMSQKELKRKDVDTVTVIFNAHIVKDTISYVEKQLEYNMK